MFLDVTLGGGGRRKNGGKELCSGDDEGKCYRGKAGEEKAGKEIQGKGRKNVEKFWIKMEVKKKR